MSDLAPATARITRWDRAAIVALGAAGCALSYDALQQMAIAIHIRGFLTYLFPLVIDGFIAYGVRGLLVLRAAPLRARCYVWLLFGTATAASIWANALHAVRLNQIDQQDPSAGALRLDDLTVGILSTLAPLALAGAVHLYILIARRATQDTDPAQAHTPTLRTDRPTTDRTALGQLVDALPAPCQPSVTSRQNTATPTDRESPATLKTWLSEPEPEHSGRTVDVTGHQPTAPLPTRPPRHTTRPSSGQTPRPTSNDDLLTLARRAVTEAGKTTRNVVAEAIRGQGLPLSNNRLTELMNQLRTEQPGHPGAPTD